MRRPESALKVMELFYDRESIGTDDYLHFFDECREYQKRFKVVAPARQSPIVRLAFGLKISQCKA